MTTQGLITLLQHCNVSIEEFREAKRYLRAKKRDSSTILKPEVAKTLENIYEIERLLAHKDKSLQSMAAAFFEAFPQFLFSNYVLLNGNPVYRAKVYDGKARKEIAREKHELRRIESRTETRVY